MYRKKYKTGQLTMIVVVFILVVGLVITGISSLAIIKSGTVGVVSVMGKVQEEVLLPGFNLKAPYITSVVRMDTRTQKAEVEATAASKDLQTISSTVAVNYHVDQNSAAWLYANVGRDYEQKIIAPAIQEAVKAVIAQFSAEELITERQAVSTMIKTELSAKIGTYGIITDDFNITNLDFSEEFNAAIEAKQTAQQNALKAEQDLTRITIEAQQKVAQAEAQADATKATAEAEAYAIQIIQAQLSNSPEYIEYQKIEKWNGELPMVQGSTNAIIDIRDIVGEKENNADG